MKFRIIAAIIVVAIFGGIWFAVKYVQEGSAPSNSGRPDSNDIRNLRIN